MPAGNMAHFLSCMSTADRALLQHNSLQHSSLRPLQCRFDDLHGTAPNGMPVQSVPPAVLESILRTGVCLKGTLFTPLSKSTATESLNVQVGRGVPCHVFAQGLLCLDTLHLVRLSTVFCSTSKGGLAYCAPGSLDASVLFLRSASCLVMGKAAGLAPLSPLEHVYGSEV